MILKGLMQPMADVKELWGTVAIAMIVNGSDYYYGLIQPSRKCSTTGCSIGLIQPSRRCPTTGSGSIATST